MLQQLMPRSPIIHLAFFEGIGVAQLATRYLNLNIAKTFSWEIDPFCNEILDHHFADQIQHMGDFSQTDFTEFCQQLRSTYDTTHIILITAAPPCKDHSRLRDQPPGTDGTDGSLLSQMTDTEAYIRTLLPEYTIRSLMENVIPHQNIQQHFEHITQQWGSPPALVDAADGMVMSRPRLWWNDIEWHEAESRLTKDTPFTLHWQPQPNFDQLHNPLAPLIQPSIHVKDWETPAILCQQQLFHCLTTQAPTDLGRPPPQHTNADQATWERWQTDNRQFPPWQYQPQYLTRQYQHEWQPITPLQRERLMALPDNYTKITDQHPSTRTRNTMLGNAWHFPSGLWLLFLILLTQTTQAIPQPPLQTNIQRLANIWLASNTQWGPPQKPQPHQHMPQLDWHSHLRWARSIQPPTADYTRIDPSICWAVQQTVQLPNIQQIRKNVLHEIQHLVDEFTNITDEWFHKLPKHCQKAYRQNHMITQIPTLISLLSTIHYPHTSQLQDELSHGFSLLGHVHPGVNWHVRTDTKYTNPITLTDLKQHNKTYIQKKLRLNNTDTHWKLMAEEIATEVSQGRMAGPFQAPEWFPSQTVPLHLFEHTSTLLPLPDPDPIIALAFSIEQTGSDGKAKIRRGEDWRRSGHNQACHMTDQPYHHTPDHYTWLAQFTASHNNTQPLVWGHDHDGAYRQLPLDDPSVAYVLLITPDGPTLWHHHVLLFGSAASVWAYNRFGDMLTAIARTLACIPVLHYVDDYGSIEPYHFADSGFQTFEQLNSVLGFHMKPSKRQPPDRTQRIQGVIIKCDLESVTVAPCPDRVQHICNQLHRHLQTQQMTPEQARKLAGKCSFTTTHLFGRVGRSALRALYDKAFSNNDHLTTQTQSAIWALINILQHCSPRRSPLRPVHTKHTIIYTDAFYTDGDKQLRLHHMIQDPESVKPSAEMPFGQPWYSILIPRYHLCLTAPFLQNYSSISLATKPSYISLKHGLPSSHLYLYDLFLPTSTYNFVTTMPPHTQSSKDPANTYHSTTSSEHIGPGITDNTYTRSYTEYRPMPTLPIHSAEKISP